jgi:hypothetical protein
MTKHKDITSMVGGVDMEGNQGAENKVKLDQGDSLRKDHHFNYFGF